MKTSKPIEREWGKEIDEIISTFQYESICTFDKQDPPTYTQNTKKFKKALLQTLLSRLNGLKYGGKRKPYPSSLERGMGWNDGVDRAIKVVGDILK